MVLVLTLLAGVVGCGHSAQSEHQQSPNSPSASASERPITYPAYAVTARPAVHQVAIHSSLAGPVVRRLANPAPLGVPLTFLLDQRAGGWLKVYLPVRPDGSQGWVRAADVTVAGVAYRIDVHQRPLRLDLYRFGQLIRTFPVGLGKSDTPTPGGIYYLKELLRPPDPHGFYGPYAFGLSGFSTVLHTFDGGNGVIGIHGTNDAASIGRRESHGCIRVSNRNIRYLAKLLPLGTPVRILP